MHKLMALTAAAALAVSLGAALERRSAAFSQRIFGFENIRRKLQRRGRSYERGNSIATGNRWGGPHLHQCEIARRERQQARGVN